jgi:hypothetical protein
MVYSESRNGFWLSWSNAGACISSSTPEHSFSKVSLADSTSSLYSWSLSVLFYLHFNVFSLSQMYGGFVNLSIPSQKVFQRLFAFSQYIFHANCHPFIFQTCLFCFTVFPFKHCSFSDSNYLIAFSVPPYTLWLFFFISYFSLSSISKSVFVFSFRLGPFWFFFNYLDKILIPLSFTSLSLFCPLCDLTLVIFSLTVQLVLCNVEVFLLNFSGYIMPLYSMETG